MKEIHKWNKCPECGSHEFVLQIKIRKRLNFSRLINDFVIGNETDNDSDMWCRGCKIYIDKKKTIKNNKVTLKV